jgi:aminoglycoside phosphotransferase
MIGLAPDPAVPQRDALLDPRAVANLLGAATGERTYAKYRFGESLRVVHRIDGRHVAARTFPEGESERAYERARSTAVPSGDLPPVLHAPELRTVLWTFPNDRRLRSLPRLTDGARLLGRPCATRVVAYAAEESATAQCIGEDGRVAAYAKVGAGGERAALEAAAAHVRVPRVLRECDGVLVLEPLPGRRLDTLAPDELRHALRGLGRALAALHATAPPPTRFARLDTERLASAVAVIARGRPDAGGPAARVLAALLHHPEHAAGPDVCLHGDANLRNALVDGDTVALIDLEHTSAGPAAADLGHVLAGLHAAGAQELGDPLIAGYGDLATPPEPDSLRWHISASVLARIALPAVNRVRPNLLSHLRCVLEAIA